MEVTASLVRQAVGSFLALVAYRAYRKVVVGHLRGMLEYVKTQNGKYKPPANANGGGFTPGF